MMPIRGPTRSENVRQHKRLSNGGESHDVRFVSFVPLRHHFSLKEGQLRSVLGFNEHLIIGKRSLFKNDVHAECDHQCS